MAISNPASRSAPASPSGRPAMVAMARWQHRRMLDLPTEATPIPADWWRRNPDSSTATQPRVLSTVFVTHAELDATVLHWTTLLGVAQDAHLPLP